MIPIIWWVAKAAAIEAHSAAIKAVVAIKAAGAAHSSVVYSSLPGAHYEAASVLNAGAIVPGIHAGAASSGQAALAGGASKAAALLHAAESQAVHAAASPIGSHLTKHMAKEAGQLAANSLASGGSHALSTASIHATPLHFTAYGVLTTTTRAAVTTGTIYGGAKVVEKLARSFAEGFTCQVAKNEWQARVDQRNITSWFIKNTQAAKRVLMFTATGTVVNGTFRAAPPRGEPYTILQGYFDPYIGRMTAGRIVNRATSVSESVLRDHRATGIAVYAQATS